MGILPPIESKRKMASKLESRSPLSSSGVEIFAASRKVSGNEIIPRMRNRVDILEPLQTFNKQLSCQNRSIKVILFNLLYNKRL